MPSPSKLIISFILLTTAIALPTPQLAGEGQAFDSIFTDTDNGVGYGIENAEDNIAGTVAALKGTSATGPANPPPPTRRQLDKVSNGFQAIGNAAGVGGSTAPLTDALDNVDGDLTSGAANAGAALGQTEEQTLEDAGKAVPKM
ncbi:hypothetical protein FB567DRAFT_180679 [Paraphoma chrysanthemicola]|uniref:Uncharacterized protein n=1 Tax=Paraphoma chrysanthemicola TaxID=798071 RepID=A0A8K0W4I2_9PLEO|nr:hypothetical protein FB567DRAFT_180679 [Paraphoma chrysanthemicola]